MTDCAVCQPHPEPCRRNRDNKSTAGLNVCTSSLHIKTIRLYGCEKARVKHVSRDSKDLLFFCLLLKKKRKICGWDMYRCVITQHVCITLTNLIRDWAAKNTCFIQNQLMWQANNYTGLSWVTVTLFLYPFISSHNTRNCSERQCVAGGWLHRKNTQWKILWKEDHGALCQGIIQMVPYYSVFQQLVICLISVLESNGFIIRPRQSDRQTEGEEVRVVIF